MHETVDIELAEDGPVTITTVFGAVVYDGETGVITPVGVTA